MLHIYTGDGKGKTTAAVGLAVRARGAGMSVFFYQFMKSGDSSELEMLSRLGIEVKACTPCKSFIWLMDDAEKKAVRDFHDGMLAEICGIVKLMKADKPDSDVLIILDEFFSAYNTALLDRALADQLIAELGKAEIVLTGRDAPKGFIDVADYVTEMECVKHPYNKGIEARKGIEY